MTSLYALREPGTGALRYIGKTVQSPKKRLSSHLSDARNGGKGHRCNWLRSLSVTPSMEVISVIQDRYASDAERFAIALMRAGGELLVNDTDGGEGQLGLKHTPEARAKISASKQGGKHTPETRAKISVAGRGNKSASGHKRTPETRAKISAARIGRKHTPETCAKISASLLAKGAAA